MKMPTSVLLVKSFDYALWLVKAALLCAAAIVGAVVCCFIIVLFYGTLLGAIAFRDGMEDV